MDADALLQELVDRARISDVVNRYATGMDLRDWELFRSCFTDPVELDFSSFHGGPPQKLPAADWVAGVRAALSGFDATQHVSSNHVHTIHGERATCVSYMKAEHFLANREGDGSIALGGYYTNELERAQDSWRIRKCTLTVTWSRGNRHLFQLAAERGKGEH